ncbi:hypothetical protein [Neobacillus soli]|uniref:hypothetical protein n=1 Tax=Neobacillus soli TaxID=220688 RepID=UPI000826AA92|nr:hypothetical protein [Neobacillus soli]
MSLKLHALAFLKEKRVNYYIIDDVIFFSCFHCGFKIEMNAGTTEWSCDCGNKGNLGSLIKFEKNKIELLSDLAFINPKKEKYEINYLLNKLNNKNQVDSKDLKLIQDKFNKLCKELGI